MAKRATDRQKLTFMIPNYLIQLADMQAGELGLERYEVLRMAIGQGLMAIRVQQQLQKDPDRFVAELRSLTSGKPGAYSDLDKKVSDAVVADVQAQLKKKKA